MNESPEARSLGLIAVHPRWLTEANRTAGKLAEGVNRFVGVFADLQPNGLDAAIIGHVSTILERFADGAQALIADLDAIKDGTSKFVISHPNGGDPGGGDPPSPVVDLLELAQQFRAGLVVGDLVIVENESDHGHEPDALVAAIRAIADRLEQIDPTQRSEARMIVVLEADPTPLGATADIESAARAAGADGSVAG